MGACKSRPTVNEVKEELVSIQSNVGVVADVYVPDSETDHTAKEADLQWINYMIRVMWPYVRQAMIKKATQKFKDKMSEELAKHPQVKIEQMALDFDPGTKPPRITSLIAYQRTQQERNGLQVDVDFVWQPDKAFHSRMTLVGHAAKFPIDADGVGVSGMDVKGTMSMLMAPLLDVEPCVGTGQAFFFGHAADELARYWYEKAGPHRRLVDQRDGKRGVERPR